MEDIHKQKYGYRADPNPYGHGRGIHLYTECGERVPEKKSSYRWAPVTCTKCLESDAMRSRLRKLIRNYYGNAMQLTIT